MSRLKPSTNTNHHVYSIDAGITMSCRYHHNHARKCQQQITRQNTHCRCWRHLNTRTTKRSWLNHFNWSTIVHDAILCHVGHDIGLYVLCLQFSCQLTVRPTLIISLLFRKKWMFSKLTLFTNLYTIKRINKILEISDNVRVSHVQLATSSTHC